MKYINGNFKVVSTFSWNVLQESIMQYVKFNGIYIKLGNKRYGKQNKFRWREEQLGNFSVWVL